MGYYKLKEFFKEELEEFEKIYQKFIKFIHTKKLQFTNNKKEIEFYTNEDYFDYFNFDLIDIKGIRYNYLSSGEQNIFSQLLQISFYASEGNGLLFLFDEPELSLHPQWQKQYINEISILLKNTNSHFIFTSHSPFLLSDIPKQNIIFLDKDEKGNCKTVDGLKDKKQTFGANIHTLLSDGFFMDNGLMGEFAKEKIDRVIELLNQDKLDEKDLKYCEQIISIIGEPIIKNQLQRMLDSKRLSKIDSIDKKIKDMSYELEILKQYQSKIVQDELKDKGKKKYKQRIKNDKN